MVRAQRTCVVTQFTPGCFSEAATSIGRKLLQYGAGWERGFNAYFYNMNTRMGSLTSGLEKIQRENIQPAVVQKESQINFAYSGTAWRGVSFANNFLVVLEGKFIAKYTSKFLFRGETSSAYRLFIDGRVVLFR